MTASKDERAGFGSVDLQALPNDPVFNAAAFAVHKHGNVGEGVTTMHLLAVGSYLLSKSFEGVELVAFIAKGYELLQAAQNSVH